MIECTGLSVCWLLVGWRVGLETPVVTHSGMRRPPGAVIPLLDSFLAKNSVMDTGLVWVLNPFAEVLLKQ